MSLYISDERRHRQRAAIAAHVVAEVVAVLVVTGQQALQHGWGRAERLQGHLAVRAALCEAATLRRFALKMKCVALACRAPQE